MPQPPSIHLFFKKEELCFLEPSGVRRGGEPALGVCLLIGFWPPELFTHFWPPETEG